MIDWNKQMINNGITLVAVFSIGVIAKFIFARPQCFVPAGYNITRSIWGGRRGGSRSRADRTGSTSSTLKVSHWSSSWSSLECLAANNFIPRTERIPAEASHQLSPAEFAEILIKKLEKVKREQELEEKLNRKLAEDAQSMVSQGSNRSLADILREKLIVTDDLDGDQSILDDHVSRIWTDKTPLRSPGDPSGRPRSPGYSRSRPVASLPPRLGSSVGLGAMGPPPPRRAVQTAGRRTGGSSSGLHHHQDLAYYDLGQAGHAPPAGAGVNERVREWMLDVERQQSVEVGQDQRSHSSKGNVKTSPRWHRSSNSLDCWCYIVYLQI